MNVIDGIQLTSGFKGEIWECGTFQGKTAFDMKQRLIEINDNHRNIRMFDTFTGQPFCGQYDFHKQGSMNKTSYELVKDKFTGYQNIYIESGMMPFTFSGLENVKLSVSNIDVDNYYSVKECLNFIYPRTQISGYIFLDDYGCSNCLGAKKAVDEFLIDKKEKLLGDLGPEGYIFKE